MEIVGIDFGTTNVRISIWDQDGWDQDDHGAQSPYPCEIGRGTENQAMPVVVALLRRAGGDVDMEIGEDADVLEDGPNTVVIRNIKRWALSGDPYVNWRLEVSNTQWPTWWNPELGCVQVWGHSYSAAELMAAILREAVSRARQDPKTPVPLPDRFEWRAGCPVQSGYDYRTLLADVLSGIAGQGNVSWVVDEPVLFLAAAQRNIDPDSPVKLEGDYMVYDLGGGSFDCALVDVRNNGEMIVYGADGHPLLGGSNIDRQLTAKFPAPENSLRVAKENVSPDHDQAEIGADASLTWTDVETELRGGKFIPLSLMAMRDAYVSARTAVSGTVAEENEETGEVRFVWQRDYSDMARDLDGVVLFGGPTKSPFFAENLRRWFGDDKVFLASDLIGGVPDPEITGVSMGACYYPSGNNFHEVPSRLPFRVALENVTTGRQEDRVEYRPHQHFVDTFRPAEQFESPWLPQERGDPQEYELTITDPDGVVLEQVAVDGYLEPDGRQPATGLRLVIDRLGPVYVEKRSEGVGLPWTKRFTVVEHPPWQTEEQREMLEALRQRQRERESGRRAHAGHQMSDMERHPEP